MRNAPFLVYHTQLITFSLRTVLPQVIKDALMRHLIKVKVLHENDLAEGYDEVYLPFLSNNRRRSAMWRAGYTPVGHTRLQFRAFSQRC
jgi:hypothetical protein